MSGPQAFWVIPKTPPIGTRLETTKVQSISAARLATVEGGGRSKGAPMFSGGKDDGEQTEKKSLKIYGWPFFKYLIFFFECFPSSRAYALFFFCLLVFFLFRTQTVLRETTWNAETLDFLDFQPEVIYACRFQESNKSIVNDFKPHVVFKMKGGYTDKVS